MSAPDFAEEAHEVRTALDIPDDPAGSSEPIIAAALRAAYERGSRDEREACAEIAAERGRTYHENYMSQELDDDYELNEGASAAASEIEARIRRRGRE